MSDIQFLKTGGFIAVGAVWTDREAALAGRLSKSLVCVLHEPLGFIQEAFQALAPGGDCTGLAYRSESGKQLLGEFLRCALGQSVQEGFLSPGRRKDILAAVERLEAGLSEWSEHPDWIFLKRPPRSVGNRVSHFQSMLLDTPAYSIIAASLHRGIIAKIDQLARLPVGHADRLLGGAIQPVIHIVRAIPADAIGDLKLGSPPAELDQIVWDAVRSMPRRRDLGRPGMRYARSSLHTFMNNWHALYRASARGREFDPGRFHGSHPSFLQTIRGMDDEDLADDKDHQLYLSRLEAQTRLEEKELGHNECRPGPKRRSGNPVALDAARAIVALTPSATMPGALPLVVVALIHEWLGVIAGGEGSGLNAKTMQALVLTLLHTGRRPEWLLELMLGNRPPSVRRYAQSIYDPSHREFFHRPEEYLGLPPRFLPPNDGCEREWEDFQRVWQEHDAVYEPIQLVWEIPLPPILRAAISRMMKARKSALRCKKIEPKSKLDPLWLWEEKKRLLPLGMDRVKAILDDLSAYIRTRMPGYPAITPTNFIRTFEGRYADAGLRPEHRWYISGRLAHGAEMENRYSRVSSRAIASAQCDAAGKVCTLYEEECRQLGVSTDFLQSSKSRQAETPAIPEQFFGSWRVASRDLVVDLIKELLAGLHRPETHEPDLPRRLAAHNARVRFAVIGLGLLSGVRKSEIVLLRRQDIDLEDGWIAVRGKPHRNRPAYRRLPLLPEMATLLRRIHPKSEMSAHPKMKMFALYDQNRQAHDLTPAVIEEMLDFMGGRLGLRLMPDFYGLRHRFRSDWLARGAPTAVIDFLMGHESVGMEAHSIYRDSRIKGLMETYRTVAGELAREYSWVDPAP